MNATPSRGWRCRWCGSAGGSVVLDLGLQPAADHFPLLDDPGPDPAHPLRMVLCEGCGLAQLEDDPTGVEEPRGVEPAALVAQARDAVRDLVDAGLAPAGSRVVELPSPHGGSWLPHVREAVSGSVVDDVDDSADLVVDSLGLMHEPDQRAAWRRRSDLLAPEGVLALHVHPLTTILRDGTWNALRHGHYAYFSLTALVAMARAVGLVPVGLWRYQLYGGTCVVAFARARSRRALAAASDDLWGEALAENLRAEAAVGVTRADSVAVLQQGVTRSATALRSWLDARRGDVVVGYGAASRAVALLSAAGVTARDVAAVADASPAKHGRAMPVVAPATHEVGGLPLGPPPRVPVVAPSALTELRPAWVLVFVPDLLDEVRSAYPEVEEAGGRWVVAEPEPRVVPPVAAGQAVDV